MASEPNWDIRHVEEKDMEQVEISSPGRPGMVTMRISGQDISRFLQSVSVDMQLHEPPVATVEVLGSEGMRLNITAVVQPIIRPFPGYRLVETFDGDRRIFTTEPEESTDGHASEIVRRPVGLSGVDDPGRTVSGPDVRGTDPTNKGDDSSSV